MGAVGHTWSASCSRDSRAGNRGPGLCVVPCSVACPPPGPTRKSRKLQMPSLEACCPLPHSSFPRKTARYSVSSLRHTLSGVNRPHLYTDFHSLVFSDTLGQGNQHCSEWQSQGLHGRTSDSYHLGLPAAPLLARLLPTRSSLEGLG